MTRVLLSSVTCVAILSILADGGPAEAAKRGSAFPGGRPIIVTDLTNPSHSRAGKLKNVKTKGGITKGIGNER